MCACLLQESLSSCEEEALLIGKKAFRGGKERLSSYSIVLSFAVILSFSLSF